MQQLSLHLAENLAELDARFGASADYYAKEIMIYHCRGCIVLFDGMASLDSLWELLLDAARRCSSPAHAPGRKCMSTSCMVPLPRPRAPRWGICRILSSG